MAYIDYKINRINFNGIETIAYLSFYEGDYQKQVELKDMSADEDWLASQGIGTVDPNAEPTEDAINYRVEVEMDVYKRSELICKDTVPRLGDISLEEIIPFCNTLLIKKAAEYGLTPILEQVNG